MSTDPTQYIDYHKQHEYDPFGRVMVTKVIHYGNQLTVGEVAKQEKIYKAQLAKYKYLLKRTQVGSVVNTRCMLAINRLEKLLSTPQDRSRKPWMSKEYSYTVLSEIPRFRYAQKIISKKR